MPFEIQYIHDDRIIIRKFAGEISFKEVMESWTHLISNELISPECIGIINDFTEAKLQMQMNNLDKLFDFFLTYYDVFKKIKLAVIMNTPAETVLPILAKEEHPQFKIQAFCTFDAAEKWVLKNK
jgi:hypothetical protein